MIGLVVGIAFAWVLLKVALTTGTGIDSTLGGWLALAVLVVMVAVKGVLELAAYGRRVRLAENQGPRPAERGR